jgi:hypothetical protein
MSTDISDLRAASIIRTMSESSLPIEVYYMRFQVLTAASMKFRVFRDILPCSQIDVDRRFRGEWLDLMMEVAHTTETSVDIDLTTRQYIPEKSELHTRRSENIKSHNHPNTLFSHKENNYMKFWNKGEKNESTCLV